MTKFAMLKILLILSLFVLLARTTPLIETQDAFGDGGAIGTKRIAGGVPAERGEMPWMVSIQYTSLGQTKHMCGGVIINATHVLTAAHCMEGNLYNFRIIAGALRIFANEPDQQSRTLVERISHAYFQKGPPTRHDLAILQVDPPFNFNEHVNPLLMPPTDHRASGNCTIAGWGYTLGGPQSEWLLKTEVPIVSRTECLEIYEHNYEPENQICAGYDEGGHDSCSGDTGGPLVCTDTLGYKYVAGISSWGESCGLANRPGVYTEVSHYTVGMWQPVHLELPEF